VCEGVAVEMPPAWEMIFGVVAGEGRDWSGELADTSTTLRSDPSGRFCGLIGVRSAQPYRDEALAEGLSRAMNVCRMFTAAQGAVYAVEPEPIASEELAGAKGRSHEPAGGRRVASGSMQLTHSLPLQPWWLKGADALAADPELRSAIDTYTVALGQRDPASRLISLYRVFDLFATRALNDEPLLLSQDDTNLAVSAARAALDGLVDPAALDRIEWATRNALSKVRLRSRKAVVAEALSRQGVHATDHDIDAVTTLRAKIGHRPTPAELVIHEEALGRLTGIVRGLIQAQTSGP
jgi:hypothetical protein